ncbi:hypothetical protein [Photobacterium damselae]|uniref:hypothetical protein n=1 Tax=Photobacterium damselae TaxID=38293 RepID=UPI0013027848|nr:hypothetical protein [Photobacterium damselae]
MSNKSVILASIFSSLFISNAANADITLTGQKNFHVYDKTSFTPITVENVIKDSGVEYSSDNDWIMILLNGRRIDQNIASSKEGLHEDELMVFSEDSEGNPLTKTTTIKYEVRDIDNPVEIMAVADKVELPLSSNYSAISALDFARSYKGVNAKDGIAYATFNGNQYMDTYAPLGQRTGTLYIMDIDGQTAEAEITYDVVIK